jgi:hypothetical protein
VYKETKALLEAKIIQSPLVMLTIVLLVSGSFYSIIKLSGYTYVHSILSLTVMPLIIVLLSSKAMKKRNEKTKIHVFFSVLLPLIAIFHVVSACVALDVNAIFEYVMAYAFIVLLCSLRLFFAYVEVRVIRIGLGIIYSIVLIPVLAMSLVGIFFAVLYSLSSHEPSSFVSRTVVRSALSPNAIFLAEIIDADAGATGGNTLVYVIPLNHDLNLFIGTLKKDSQIVYKGRWGEFASMTLRWEGDKILYINEKQYVVK